MRELLEIGSDSLTEDRLAWHKPEVQRLHVALDTGISPGSVVDGVDGSDTLE